MGMALQARLSVSLKLKLDGFEQRKGARFNNPFRRSLLAALGDQKIPPQVDKDQHAVQAQVQAIPSTCLLIGDKPVFYFSFELFFYLFHKIQALF
jgi:hypothetical protein